MRRDIMAATQNDYRPEIDGLRAVAISLVVVYHAFPRLLPGGFVGVDVFFVISGFLITRIVVAPGFAWRRFYERRVLRLFPALVIVLAVTTLAGRSILAPDDFRQLLRYVWGGGLFSANVVAYLNDGYFSGATELKPLIHLWSLGVEEQFYLVWPLALRWIEPGRRVRFTAWVGVASFALYLWLAEVDP